MQITHLKGAPVLLCMRGYGATAARLTPDQKGGSSNLSALTISELAPTGGRHARVRVHLQEAASTSNAGGALGLDALGGFGAVHRSQ